MTKMLRRVGMFSLVLLMTAFTIAGASTPVSAQEDECYPVPAGGCPDVADDCSSIVAAIEAGDTSLDQNGDGEINEADLPAECTCEELLTAIADGTIDASQLPEGALADCGCSEILDGIAAGTLDPANLPAGAAEALASCGCDEVLAAISAGTLDPANLPEGAQEALASCGCAEILEAINAGTLDGGALPQGALDALANCGCDELVDAIVAGVVDPADLPGDLADLLGTCCEALVDAIVAGDLSADSLPDGLLEECDCDAITALIDAGVLDADALPEDCTSIGIAGDDEEQPEPDLGAVDTGLDTAGLAGVMALALLGGAGTLVLSRRRSA